MTIARWLLAVVLSSGLAAWGGYKRGHDTGVLITRDQVNTRAVSDLSALIASHQQLIDEANQAGRELAAQTARRAEHDNQTTRELRDALAKTADQRVHCVFDLGVMHQLARARDRAAQAAATGLDEPVPAATARTRE